MTAQKIIIAESGLNVVIEVCEDGDVLLLHFSSLPFDDRRIPMDSKRGFRLLELQCTGQDQDDHRGSKHTGAMPGRRMKYVRHTVSRNEYGKMLELDMEHEGIEAACYFQFYDGIPVARQWSLITNQSAAAAGLEYVSSFALYGCLKEGLGSWDKKAAIYIPHNSWAGEACWKRYAFDELGYSRVWDHSSKRIAVSSTGSWSTVEYLPMGILENAEPGNMLFWQIEHNGSWHWELGDTANTLYLQISGPTENENGWWKELKIGESFSTVPVAVGVTNDGFDDAIKRLTIYRRRIRRKNTDNDKLPVIFNDYMNCLMADPTTAKLIPLIDSAARAGCEYFVIDAGWYSDGYWWDGVGEWLPSAKRFPGPDGIREPLDYIRSKGMIPGLWLEIEVMGVNCPLAKELPDNWFFSRHGKRVIDHGRYQLDFRSAEVREHASGVIKRIVEQYGVGYIKMDYNINIGLGTDFDADSPGDGLLEHNRAYLTWLDSILQKYPAIVIENCGSGGLRMDYALLSRLSLQSSSDQQDYRRNALISAAVLTAVTPEQCAAWSYPKRDGDAEEVIFNMINAMLMRIHQSGHLAEISSESFELVKLGIERYKMIRADLKEGFPFWPLGLPEVDSGWLCLGMDCGGKVYLAVWKLADPGDACAIKLPRCTGASATCIYPTDNGSEYEWESETGSLSVKLHGTYKARLFSFIKTK